MTRGERNNNFGNIRHGAKWQGLSPEQPDKDFCTFISPEYGIRAMGMVLLTYYGTYKLRTIDGIIRRWAPPSENNTDAYIESVCVRCNKSRDSDLHLTRMYDMLPLVRSIIFHENGKAWCTDEQIEAGLKLAGVV